MATLKPARIDSVCETANCILLDEIVIKIIQNIPIAEWSQLEIVSKQFLRCTQSAYCALRTLNLKDIFLHEFENHLIWRKEEVFELFLAKLISRCPLLQTVCGLDCLLGHIQPHHLDLLSELTEIKNVSFRHVDIGDLSRFLKKFPHMKSLEIDSSFVGPFYKHDAHFDFFGNLYGLIELMICRETHCSGSFLSMINAENLKVLNFTGSAYKATHISALLNRSVNLETLHLFDPTTCVQCKVGVDLELIHCLPYLTKLRKFELHIHRESTACLAEHELTYDSTDLLEVLIKCKSLRDICLQNDYFRVKLLNDCLLDGLIAECPQLELLDFDMRHCSSEVIVSNIIYLENLTHLVIGNRCNALLGGLCLNLHNLNNLSHLVFNEAKETELMFLKSLKHLTHFTCMGEITETVVRNWIMIGFLKKLTYLKIGEWVSYIDKLNGGSMGDIVKAIAENAPNLKSFLVSQGQINDETLLVIAECCKCLKLLDIQFGPRITEKGLLSFLLTCGSLRCLNIHRSYVRDFQVNVILQPFKHVVHFLLL